MSSATTLSDFVQCTTERGFPASLHAINICCIFAFLICLLFHQVVHCWQGKHKAWPADRISPHKPPSSRAKQTDLCSGLNDTPRSEGTNEAPQPLICEQLPPQLACPTGQHQGAFVCFAAAQGREDGKGEQGRPAFLHTAQLRRDEELGNAPKPLTVPSYNLNNCPFIQRIVHVNLHPTEKQETVLL